MWCCFSSCSLTFRLIFFFVLFSLKNKINQDYRKLQLKKSNHHDHPPQPFTTATLIHPLPPSSMIHHHNTLNLPLSQHLHHLHHPQPHCSTHPTPDNTTIPLIYPPPRYSYCSHTPLTASALLRISLFSYALILYHGVCKVGRVRGFGEGDEVFRRSRG